MYLFFIALLIFAAGCASGVKTQDDLQADPPSETMTKLREEIRGAIRSDMPKIKGCFSEALKSYPGLKGKIVIKMMIEPDGNVSSAKVKSSNLPVANSGMEECTQNVIKGIHFELTERVAKKEVDYPFLFSE